MSVEPQVPGVPAQIANPDESNLTPVNTSLGPIWVIGHATIE